MQQPNGKRLAIIGASVRAATHSAIRAGCDVVAADLFADADLQQIAPATAIDNYPQGFAAWLREQSVDGWLYTGGLENHPDLLDELATQAPLLGSSGKALRQSRDPLWLQEALHHAGVCFPKTARAQESTFDQANQAMLAKTYRGSSGTGIWRANHRKAFQLAQQQDAYLQEEVGKESASAVFIVDQNQATLIGITRQQLHAGAWQYVGSAGPANRLIDQHPTLHQTLARVEEVLTNIGLRGIVGVDLMLDDTSCWPIEINPRYPASAEILEICGGISLVDFHVQACLGQRVCMPTQQVSSPLYGAKSIVFASRDVKINPVLAEEILAKSLSMTTTWPPLPGLYYADVPQAGTLIEAEHPIATLLSFSTSSEASASATLEEAVRLFHNRLEPSS